MRMIEEIRRRVWRPMDDIAAPSRGVICNWVRDSEDGQAPLVDLPRYFELLTHLPDKVVENLEKSRLAHEGRMPLLKAGLGYEELLSTVVVDGTAIASSSTEAFLFPAVKLPANFLGLQPNVPGKVLHWKGRGRHTTLTTAATLLFKYGAALTNVIPTTTWAISGAITMDATAQTASQWFCEGLATVRAVGSAGTIHAQGDATSAAQALTIANQHAQYMGSAGQDTPATAVVDTTVDQYVSLTGKWSLATAYSITGHNFILEALD